MSSILKALKRVEGQSPPPQSFPALPDSIDAKQAINSKARKRWLQRRFITVSLVLLVMVATAVIVFQQRQIVTSKIFPAGSTAEKQKKNMAAQEESKIFRAKIPPATIQQASRKQGPTRPTGQQNKTTPAVTKKQPTGGISSHKSDRKASPQQKFTPSKKSIAGKRTVSSKPAPVAKKYRKSKTYAKLTDSEIKLQALAWSSDAARRIAVINGRIVREGESIDGYQINLIRQEDVVVSDGRQTWSLEFGLKQ